MVDRTSLLRTVTERLGSRQLVWAGLRGDDIEPLNDVPQLSASFSIVGEFARRSDVSAASYEAMTGVRVDPEVWDIDDHHSDQATIEFRHGLLRALSPASALLAYRPSSFLSAIHFARRERCINLGLFGAHQSVFEHKPFVESAVADLGLPHIPWTYVADEDQLLAQDLASDSGLVLRSSRTSGGEGFLRVDSPSEVAAHWPSLDEGFVCVAPFITDAVPVNVGAVVWPNGSETDCVSVHYPSVQLIGIGSCVTRPFGYCGNDFGRARELPRLAIEQIEESTKAIGRWLRGNGYVGAFGVDYLVKDGVPLFTEVNPRFQGSTHASCRLSIENGEACLMLEHLAAWLRVEKPASEPLWDRVRAVQDLSNLVVHWTGDVSATVNATELHASLAQTEGQVHSDSVVPARILSDPGSIVARFGVRKSITETGYDLSGGIGQIVQQWRDGEVAL